jgi:hypothetical protein
MALNPVGGNPAGHITWPDDAVQSLIGYRRASQNFFATTRIHEQGRRWTRISRQINVDHPNFAPTKNQCRNKWNALKSGYENLSRLMNGNPERFPTHRPTLHDERFHEELSDEFWLTERNYLLLNFSFNLLYL